MGVNHSPADTFPQTPVLLRYPPSLGLPESWLPQGVIWVKRFSCLLGLLFCLSSLSFAKLQVNLISPTSNSSSAAPIHLVANGVGPGVIIGWAAYIDGQLAWSGPGTSSVDVWFPAPMGTHQLVVHAWDGHGTFGTAIAQVTVVADGLPTPPPNAIVFDKIEQNGNWGSCNSSDCAGGSGQGTYWMAQNQTTPALSGSSAEFFNSGAWANALWWQKLGPNSNMHNLLWDFYFYLDSNANASAQALEFDSFQFINGYNYMMGTECVYPSQIWDTWDEASSHWIHSSIACPHFAPNTWHHMQLYTTTDANKLQYTYVAMVIDGVPIPMNITGNAKNLNWGNNIGVQWQLDLNANGNGYHEWMDNAKLTIW